MCLLLAGGLYADNPPPAVARAVQDQVDTWLALRRETAREEERWLEQKSFLQIEVEILQAEKSELESALTQLESSLPAEPVAPFAQTPEFDPSGLEPLLAQSYAFLQSEKDLLPSILQPTFREHLAAWGGAPDLAGRLDVVLGAFSQLEAWEQQIHLAREVFQADAGRRERRVIYLGTAHAWMLAEEGTPPMSGVINGGKWEWSALPKETAGPLEQAARMLAREIPPEWIWLPIPEVGTP